MKKLIEITPNLGIGDILIIKLREISNDIKINKINIRLNLIHEYVLNTEIKINFLKLFFKLLFPEAELHFINDCPYTDLLNYKINQIYLYDYIKLNKINNYNNYIIFHTKVRIDGYSDNFKKYILPVIDNYIKNLKTSKNIILMGERIIEKNIETTIHGVISLYDLLIQLNNNNNLIDLTKELLCSGNSNFDNFLEDIEIINKADCNINFGIGGPFCISNIFSKNVINFIPQNNYSNKDFLNLINNNFSDINEFINKINYYI